MFFICVGLCWAAVVAPFVRSHVVPKVVNDASPAACRSLHGINTSFNELEVWSLTEIIYHSNTLVSESRSKIKPLYEKLLFLSWRLQIWWQWISLLFLLLQLAPHHASSDQVVHFSSSSSSSSSFASSSPSFFIVVLVLLGSSYLLRSKTRGPQFFEIVVFFLNLVPVIWLSLSLSLSLSIFFYYILNQISLALTSSRLQNSRGTRSPIWNHSRTFRDRCELNRYEYLKQGLQQLFFSRN